MTKKIYTKLKTSKEVKNHLDNLISNDEQVITFLNWLDTNYKEININGFRDLYTDNYIDYSRLTEDLFDMYEYNNLNWDDIGKTNKKIIISGSLIHEIY
jgi:hypothetical protein